MERKRAELHQRADGLRTRTSPSAEFARLTEWREYGNDPAGLGAWPKPKPPRGPQLPQLGLHAKIHERLAEGRTALDLHRLAHTWGRMVEDGALDYEKHKAVYLFSNAFESHEIAALSWEERQKNAAPERERQAAEDAARDHGLTDDAIANVLEGTPWGSA